MSSSRHVNQRPLGSEFISLSDRDAAFKALAQAFLARQRIEASLSIPSPDDFAPMFPPATEKDAEAE